MRLLYGVSLIALSLLASAQQAAHLKDSLQIRAIYNEALLHGESYSNLRELCKDIGHRLTGSPQSLKAVDWAVDVVSEYGYDRVYKQPIQAPMWVRGDVEEVKWGERELEVLALGKSVGTVGVIKAHVVEVNTIDDLASVDPEQLKGAIVFFNEPMDKTRINTFEAYGSCAKQRYWGASKAAEYGAVGVLIRSLTTLTDHFPHTGSMGYSDGVKKIPAAAVSTAHADELHAALVKGEKVELSMNLNCYNAEPVNTFNVIGEITGSEFPDQIIVVGGHMDSWDVGEGAHDDGAGVVQSMEVLRMFKALGIRPKHTIRMVLFMNEESGNKGGSSYAEIAKKNGEDHIVAIESDRGGFTPRGFSVSGNKTQLETVRSWSKLLEPYGLHYFEPGFGGVDIGPLKNEDNLVNPDLLLMGLVPDPQRYFDYHHTDDDVFENVNQRELELGGASMAAMIYLLDKYWHIL